MKTNIFQDTLVDLMRDKCHGVKRGLDIGDREEVIRKRAEAAVESIRVYVGSQGEEGTGGSF